jgi:DNA recombination protein RmuC
MLAPGQYEVDVSTVVGSRDRVEYAIKLPGYEDGKPVYLPIDSKFPLEDYYRLLEGYEAGDTVVIDDSRKSLLRSVRTFAKDVTKKYVSPPETTNFAILFFPTEGLYSEIVRNPTFLDELRREGIIITGPSTLSAMLNSMQIGFKTLQIQKGAADIEKTLGKVKKEFESFEGVLTKARNKIRLAGEDLDTLSGTRSNAIRRSLRDVQVYTGDEQILLIDAPETDEIEEVNIAE